MDWDLIHVRREAWEAAQADRLAHIAAHDGPLAETIPCVRLSGECYGIGADIADAAHRRLLEYEEAFQ